MEKDIFGGPTQRENAERAWRKMHCLSIVKSMSNQAMDLDFISFISKRDFGGGMQGDMRAAEYIASRNDVEINHLFRRYVNERCEY